MCKCCSPKVKFILSAIYASIEIVLGVVSSIVFELISHNTTASVLSRTTAVFALLNLILATYLYIYVEINFVRPKGALLFIFGVIGVAGIVIGLVSGLVFLGIGAVNTINNKKFNSIDLVICMRGFSTFKWGITTFVYAFKAYRRVYVTGYYHDKLQEETNEGEVELEDNNEGNNVQEPTI